MDREKFSGLIELIAALPIDRRKTKMFEYRILMMGCTILHYDIEKTLNIYAEEGWELDKVVINQHNTTFLYLKRNNPNSLIK